MKSFKDFGIEKEIPEYTGEKIKIDKILNQPIVVYSFKIELSKRKPGADFMTLQIEYKGEKRVIFTGAVGLMSIMRKVPEDGFPFSTTIIKPNEYYEFS